LGVNVEEGQNLHPRLGRLVILMRRWTVLAALLFVIALGLWVVSDSLPQDPVTASILHRCAEVCGALLVCAVTAALSYGLAVGQLILPSDKPGKQPQGPA
jgi:hypothetical protein